MSFAEHRRGQLRKDCANAIAAADAMKKTVATARRHVIYPGMSAREIHRDHRVRQTELCQWHIAA
jgi:hypothetical protein